MKVRLAAIALAVLSLAVTGVVAPSGIASAAPCSDVDISFARATNELPGFGFVGWPFVSTLQGLLLGRTVSTYAVNYAANTDQTSAGMGSRDLVDHITSYAAVCPSTAFVIGGYSQGATVVTNAVGLKTASSMHGAVIPAALANRVKAVVVFGSRFGLTSSTIETASATYGPFAKTFCNSGDSVCQVGGFNPFAHLMYGMDGSAARGATFAAARIGR